jgi:hypothetical protein
MVEEARELLEKVNSELTNGTDGEEGEGAAEG